MSLAVDKPILNIPFEETRASWIYEGSAVVGKMIKGYLWELEEGDV